MTGMETGGLVEGGKTEMTGGKGMTEEEMVIGVGMIEEMVGIEAKGMGEEMKVLDYRA